MPPQNARHSRAFSFLQFSYLTAENSPPLRLLPDELRFLSFPVFEFQNPRGQKCPFALRLSKAGTAHRSKVPN